MDARTRMNYAFIDTIFFLLLTTPTFLPPHFGKIKREIFGANLPFKIKKYAVVLYGIYLLTIIKLYFGIVQ